ncbi:flagellar hook-associated protein FlgL [Evansella cellulosilytica]|uniref:Flagellar hook-associated protein 3 n=1 Tax=Evansella cellulosilytica (strain ATCC 21833 / DSM 2522 / FERM P-1141 / JCM 9156 / N-4) TaxID=649639 RepID=E6TS96_EVAC2|nr:flagellar hook-associated protein FlgL [Evansella cellulosilytica]ADU31865.1 flagellar hook-associated protein 3 [Evansella cellulosilytica DSM 2522]
MRVTQSMLTNSSLRHLSQSYQTLHDIQNQLATGKKISRASQDPVIAMNGMRYRTQVVETEQFNRNLTEVYNWMENADATLDQVTSTMHRIRELAVQASNDTYESTQRANISKEIEQLREHLQSLANTKANNKYIFNGTNTTNAPLDADQMNVGFNAIEEALADLPNFNADEAVPFTHVLTHNSGRYELVEKNDDGYIFQDVNNPNKSITVAVDGEGNPESFTHAHTYVNNAGETVTDTKDLKERQFVVSRLDSVSTNTQKVEIELLKGVNVATNINPSNVFSTDFFGDIYQLEKALNDPAATGKELEELIANFDRQIDKVVNERAELGARYNRVEMIDDRMKEQEVIARRILSNNEDADIEKVITNLLSSENVHRAALSSMGRIMQPTLMDFLR